ncbi:MAG: phosphoglucosamine mutase [Elusimicrobiota bacterium]|nr:phosphoglucosamine mutase [Elusimicrobiota bacterium]
MFGTDGVRGIPGKEPLTPATVAALGFHAAKLFLSKAGEAAGAAPFIIVGRDTRRSGPSLQAALAEGFAAAGVTTLDLGVIPTPGVSYLAPRLGALAGAVISASHNPAEFNGIKFFTADGFKLSPEDEAEVERRLRLQRQVPQAPARVLDGLAHEALYRKFLLSSFPATLDLAGTRLVVDCAHGAAAAYAPELFARLGAEVFPVGCKPNGKNINEGCGATHPEAMAKEVRRRKAHAGVAFDGDADRAIVCDETGAVLDGDAVIGAAAVRLQRRGGLKGGKVALTVMSNFGLVRFLSQRGVAVVTTPVGDKFVTDAIEREGLSLGGENSGHVVFRDFAPTGDGILTALQTLAAWRESGGPLSALKGLYAPTPQVLRTVKVARKPPLEKLEETQETIAKVGRMLNGRGRVFVRYSGTEPAIRVLVEGPKQGENRRLADLIVKTYLFETGQKEA